MKTNLKMVSLSMLLMAASMSSVAHASCPAELTAEEHISCIQIEGAGVLYQDYLVERAEVIAMERVERAARLNQDIVSKQQDIKPKEIESAQEISSTQNQ